MHLYLPIKYIIICGLYFVMERNKNPWVLFLSCKIVSDGNL